jgi:hypothetical protein
MSIDHILGLVTGIMFGFLLQKGRVLRFDKQVGAMLLKDMTILKFMLSAILVGMVGIQLLASLGIIALSHKAMNLGAVLVGGALFGGGWAVMGFCPGTSIGALGIAGMLVGAALYAELYPWLKSTVLALKDFGKIGIAEALGISPWLVIPVFWAGVIGLFVWFERKKL